LLEQKRHCTTMPRLFASLRRKLSGESCQCGATFADGAVFLHGGIRNITEINLVLRAKLGSKTSDSSANSAAKRVTAALTRRRFVSGLLLPLARRGRVIVFTLNA
jgi:hypothetical protein